MQKTVQFNLIIKFEGIDVLRSKTDTTEGETKLKSKKNLLHSENKTSEVYFCCCPYYWGVRYSGVSTRRELTVITQSLTHSLTHCARISQIDLSIDQSVPTKPTHFCCGEVFCQRWYSIFNGKCQNYDSIGSVSL